MITWGPKVETGNLSSPQLYNLKDDPEERENLAEKYPAKVYELQNILRKVRKNTRNTKSVLLQ